MWRTKLALLAAALFALSAPSGMVPGAWAVPVPGGTLDPLTIPKYVTPLVIPPVMHDNGVAGKYSISVRQFKQQILPGGIWNTITGRADAFPATTVWSYGPSTDNTPNSTGLGGGFGIAPAGNSQFNYPAYTIETASGTPVNVRWINELVAIDNVTGLPFPAGNPSRTFLPHLLPIDQSVHWANPTAAGCVMGTPNRTDCATNDPVPYAGPVPIITHVHGAHVDPHSDGYPEAWYLPVASNIPAGYSAKGSFFDDATGTNPGNLGYAEFYYRNDNPATTLWYHDHALGMTRNNVYAGPAGFWLIRGGLYDGATVGAGGPAAVLPGPAPVAGQTVLALNIPTDNVRRSVREIPIAIQDRSFNADGSLFYPPSRLDFDGYPGPYTGATPISTDMHPIWNPEAFFNTMVVNGVTWPKLDVAPARYRFRLLNGCNSRMINLSMCVVDPMTDNCAVPAVELPFYQIGAEQGFLSQVVQVTTGFATPLPGDGTIPPAVPAVGGATQALLMGLAERADVIVDFTGLANGTKIRMINTGGDYPFGGFPVAPVADEATTGQVMQFVVDNTLLNPSDATTTAPASLVLKKEPVLPAAAIATRQVSINELDSTQVCAQFDAITGAFLAVTYVSPTPLTAAQMLATCAATVPPSVPMGPQEAMLGTVDLSNPALPGGFALNWEDTMGMSNPVQVTMADNVTKKTVYITENPRIVGGVAPIENWEIYNFTVDAHPIHLHLVQFEVVGRAPIPGMLLLSGGIQPWESGYKDTVIAYPGEITTVRAKFDIPGLYVWHCHIVEHEDNEMMRPYVVTAGAKRHEADYDGDGKADIAVFRPGNSTWYVRRSLDNVVTESVLGTATDNVVVGDFDGNGKTEPAVFDSATGTWTIQSANLGTYTVAWGTAGDVPVAADFDGDGKTDIGVFRPSNGTWYVMKSNGGFIESPWGTMGDIPVPGDYDNDGKADLGVYRPTTGNWYVMKSAGGFVETAWGTTGDIPVPRDFDGDGKTDLGIFRPSNGKWYVMGSAGGFVETQWGTTGDIPVAGDFHGTGKADLAVFRPSNGTWYVLGSTGGVIEFPWGLGTDVPLKTSY